MVDIIQLGSFNDDQEMTPAESEGKSPMELRPCNYVVPDELLPRLVVLLEDLVLPDDVMPPPRFVGPAWCTDCYVTAWVGPLAPRLVVETPPVFVEAGGRPFLRCKFVLPIDRDVHGARLCVELVRVEQRPKDPVTSSGARVLGRARVKLRDRRPRPWQEKHVLPLFAYSPSPAYVGSIRVSMVLRDPNFSGEEEKV